MMPTIRTMSLRMAVAGVVAAAAVTVGGAPAQAALLCPLWPDPVPWSGSVTNNSSVGIGVIHLADGQCAHGLYDVILPPGKNTKSFFGWGQVAGVYIGPGYRYEKTMATGAVEYGRGADVITSGQWDGNYTIRAYPG